MSPAEAARPQRAPIPQPGAVVVPAVAWWMPLWLAKYAAIRADMGLEKYGVPLLDEDGRSKAVDALDELSSAERYLRMTRGWHLRVAWCLTALATVLVAAHARREVRNG